MGCGAGGVDDDAGAGVGAAAPHADRRRHPMPTSARAGAGAGGVRQMVSTVRCLSRSGNATASKMSGVAARTMSASTSRTAARNDAASAGLSSGRRSAVGSSRLRRRGRPCDGETMPATPFLHLILRTDSSSSICSHFDSQRHQDQSIHRS